MATKAYKVDVYRKNEYLNFGTIKDNRHDDHEVWMWREGKDVFLKIECQTLTTNQWRAKGRGLIARFGYNLNSDAEKDGFDSLSEIVHNNEEPTLEHLKNLVKKLRTRVSSKDKENIEEDYRLLCLLCDYAEKACAK